MNWSSSTATGVAQELVVTTHVVTISGGQHLGLKKLLCGLGGNTMNVTKR
jgi:hypothetical protein